MIVYGKQPVLYLLENKRKVVKRVFLSKDVDKEVFRKFSGIEVLKLDSKKAQAMARGGNHQGFLAEIEEVELTPYKDIIKKSEFILVLHSITDVGNIGSIVRTAYSLGVDGIIVTGINELKFEGMVRTSSGAIFDLKVSHNKNIYDIINEGKQQGFKFYGATLNGKDIRKSEISEKRVLVLGSESDGLPNRVLKMLDEKVTIEMARKFDSLNVSVASAILIDRMR